VEAEPLSDRRPHSFSGTGRDLSRTASRRRRSANLGSRQPPARLPGERRPRRLIEAFWRRALAVTLAAVELVLAGWLLQAPALSVRQVGISGLSHLTRGQVVAAAGLGGRTSILVVDGDSIRRDLEHLAWVRTASVQALLPDRVDISIQEWAPVAVYRSGPTGKPFYLNDQGTALAPAAASPALPEIEGAGADPRAGSRSLDAQLLAALVRIQAGFPSVYGGQTVSGFQLDCFGSLSLTTNKGVAVYFGRVLTPEQFASLSAKLSALKSIAAADPSTADPAKVEYVNLEDAQQPAVKFKAAKPTPTPSPSPVTAGASPSPSPSVPPCR
jgi:cell division septal protein FtsQ